MLCVKISKLIPCLPDDCRPHNLNTEGNILDCFPIQTRFFEDAPCVSEYTSINRYVSAVGETTWRTLDRQKHPLATAMKERLIKYRQHVFTFLYYHPVPPDNNASKRAICNVKVKFKVSGQFKSVAGAEAFATLRSVMDTAIKNNINPLKAWKL